MQRDSSQSSSAAEQRAIECNFETTPSVNLLIKNYTTVQWPKTKQSSLRNQFVKLIYPIWMKKEENFTPQILPKFDKTAKTF